MSPIPPPFDSTPHRPSLSLYISSFSLSGFLFPRSFIHSLITVAGVAATTTTTMQNQVGLRPVPLATEPALAAKFHQVPDNSIGKIRSLFTENPALGNAPGKVRKLIAENTVLVLGRRACCMCHVAKRLLLSLGVNPSVYDLPEEEEHQVMDELRSAFGDLNGGLPIVFIGGRLLGGLDSLMAAHISGELVPILKQAGALWL